MNANHKAVRAWLRSLPIPEAEKLLRDNLPEREFLAVYHSRDVTNDMDLSGIADRLHVTESRVKDIRKQAYERLIRLLLNNRL